MVADLADGVVEVLESLGDARPGHLTGLVDGGLQAERDAEQVVHDPVEEFLAAVFLLCCGSPVDAGGVARLAGPVRSRTTAMVKRPAAVASGARLTWTGKAVPSLRSPVSGVRAPIGRMLGAWA